ncbi:hypothetical protein PVBG_06127 [Plasmodium vivax Brazil I]|uniref:VIR protein n=1 Tax=Plasmodium vivax (strain Brazil I) TaxID=1033975 RepID=A0A0J9VNA3_PLAV1|nr:hypothetical protein PVBG_06127 [Plasmodium vivax Brazil I]
MNVINHDHCCGETENYLKSIEEKNKVTLKNIGCSLECGYSFLTATPKNTLTDLCDYLNLWLDLQKSIHVNNNYNVNKEDWKIVEDMWTRLKEEQDVSSQCKREHEEKDISDYSKRIELMSYCINRDYFKRLCQSSGVSPIYKAQRCKEFSDFTHDNYKKLINGIECIDNKSGIKDYKYHISDECTLYNIPKTFPKCDEKTQTIVDVDKSKKNIKKCESTANVRDSHPGFDSDTVAVALVPDALNVDQAVSIDGQVLSTNHQAVSDGDQTISEGIPFDSMRLAPLSSTDASLTDIGPSKPIYYAGLSVSGVFFTSMVLYKV